MTSSRRTLWTPSAVIAYRPAPVYGVRAWGQQRGGEDVQVLRRKCIRQVSLSRVHERIRRQKTRKASFLSAYVYGTIYMILRLVLTPLADTGERPWVCGSCPKGFARSDILKRHAMICRKLREKPHGIASLSHPQAHITTSPQAQVTQTSTVSSLASEPGIYLPISQGKGVAPSADSRPRTSAVVGVQKEPLYAGNPALAGNGAPDTWSTAFNDMGYSQQDGADAPELMHLQQLLNEGVINELKERSGW